MATKTPARSKSEIQADKVIGTLSRMNPDDIDTLVATF